MNRKEAYKKGINDASESYHKNKIVLMLKHIEYKKN